MADINQMIEVVTANNNGNFLTGSDSIEATATEWIDSGFDAITAQQWIAAGCFDSRRAGKLRDAGLSAGDVATTKDGYSLGYWFCNGDISLHDVLSAAR